MQPVATIKATVKMVQCALTHDLWQELSHHIADYLAKISLADLVARDNVQTVAIRQNTAPFDSALLSVTGI